MKDDDLKKIDEEVEKQSAPEYEELLDAYKKILKTYQDNLWKDYNRSKEDHEVFSLNPHSPLDPSVKLAETKYYIVRNAIEFLAETRTPPKERIEACINYLNQNAKTLSKRRDTCFVGGAKLVLSGGAIMLFRWLWGSTTGIRHVKLFEKKYKKLKESDDSAKFVALKAGFDAEKAALENKNKKTGDDDEDNVRAKLV